MKYRQRRVIAIGSALLLVLFWLAINPESYESVFTRIENVGAEFGLNDSDPSATATEPLGVSSSDRSTNPTSTSSSASPLAIDILEKLEVKGRAPKTGYSREEFYDGWPNVDGCSLRQRIIKREFGDTAVLDGCNVVSGKFDEPYTGEHMKFTSREEIAKIQIDHVVALSDAWQKGAQYKDKDTRYAIATDPLNLLAVDGPANMQKSDGDSATWLPSNKKFRCQYVARQISVKYKYSLWVTETEKSAMAKVLESCPTEPTIGIQ